MTRGFRTRLARLILGAIAVSASGGALTACAASAGDLAQASCKHVHASLALLAQADHATDPTEAAKLRDRAYLALLPAIPIAAQAAYHDIQWEALSTTLSEASRVPEPVLVPALQTECQSADNSVFNQAPPPSSATGT
ncbi:MAG TPA: hypothetical protein VF320_07145 [Acidimicrobiales bacterium]